MPRKLRIAVTPLAQGQLVLGREASHYLVRVHRAVAGDRFVAFDPISEREGAATVLEAHPKALSCRVDEVVRSTNVPAFELTLVQALGKGDKVERVVRDATALGATRIVLAESERSVVKLAPGRERGTRLRAIAAEAARQCERGNVPEIAVARSLTVAIQEIAASGSTQLYLHPLATASLREQLGHAVVERPLVLVIGPEGGLADAERRALEQAGFLGASLGRFVLRTETAATAALAVVMQHRA